MDPMNTPARGSAIGPLKPHTIYDNIARLVGSPIAVFPAFCAEVAELVDALDLGSSIVRCESSSLSFRTIYIFLNNHH